MLTGSSAVYYTLSRLHEQHLPHRLTGQARSLRIPMPKKEHPPTRYDDILTKRPLLSILLKEEGLMHHIGMEKAIEEAPEKV